MISARFCDGTKQRPADLERGRTSKRENPGNEVGYTDIGQVSVPQFGAVLTGVHTILDSFSCQHEKLPVIVSIWPRNILPVSHINCKNEYLDT